MDSARAPSSVVDPNYKADWERIATAGRALSHAWMGQVRIGREDLCFTEGLKELSETTEDCL